MAGTYLTVPSVSSTEAMLVKPETACLVGTSRLYGSLDVSTWTYATYGISIGLESGQSFQLGIVNDITFTHAPEFSAVEAFNLTDNSLYQVTGEETTVSVEIYEFDRRTVELALGTGTRIEFSTPSKEAVIPFGGGCNMLRRPWSLQFTNESCSAPSSQDITLGVSGGAVTLYDAFVQSGLEWALNAKETNTATLELMALPVLARTKGYRLGNIYLY